MLDECAVFEMSHLLHHDTQTSSRAQRGSIASAVVPVARPVLSATANAASEVEEDGRHADAGSRRIEVGAKKKADLRHTGTSL